jgi:hypothetical protein
LELIKVVALGLLGAIAYGVIHDQVTVRVCLEYFTIGHPPLIRSTSPTLLGLAWGVVATWWVGLPLGVMVALAARRIRTAPLLACTITTHHRLAGHADLARHLRLALAGGEQPRPTSTTSLHLRRAK